MKRVVLVLGIAFQLGIVVPLSAATIVVNHTNWNWYNTQSQTVFDRVGNLKTFFAHASVGSNMCSGVDYWHGQNSSKFKLIVTSEDGTPPTTTVAGRFYEFPRGNPSWSEKITSFVTYVNNGWRATKVDFAMNKFCYIDEYASATDYLTSMATLQTTYPSTKFVYMTMPLTTDTDASARLRHDFNVAVRNYAATHDVILYDIADIEAWSPENVEQTFTYNGNVYQKLYSGYTGDGGHPSTLEGYSRLGMALYSLFGLATDTTVGYTLTVTKTGGGSGTVTSSPAGINCGGDCSEVYAPSTNVTLTASASVGSVFAGWSGAGCVGLDPCQVAMTSNREVQAVFVVSAGATAYYSLTPCRALDTRLDTGVAAAAPILAAGTRRDFALMDRCGLPSGAKAISTTLAVVDGTAVGELQVVAGFVPSTATSAIIIPLTRSRANNATVQLSNDGSRTISVINPTTGEVHFILDITGYFM